MCHRPEISQRQQVSLSNLCVSFRSSENTRIILVDPEVKQRLDADIREAQEEISLCDSQKAEINKGIDACDVENREFDKRFVSQICLKNI